MQTVEMPRKQNQTAMNLAANSILVTEIICYSMQMHGIISVVAA